MQITYTTENTPGQTNEDLVIAGPTWVAVFDGATAPPARDTGCRHDVVWFTRHLGSHLGQLLTIAPHQPLTRVLSDAIRATCLDHIDTCNLDNPDSPSATVGILRKRTDALDYLVLADSPLVLDADGTIRPIIDDRTSHLSDYSHEGVAHARNRPGGFWVASTAPHAAEQAVTGTLPAASVRAAALLTDGASRLVDRFAQLSWPSLMTLLANDGPTELITRTRRAEKAETATDREAHHRRGKPHDDATAVYVTRITTTAPDAA